MSFSSNTKNARSNVAKECLTKPVGVPDFSWSDNALDQQPVFLAIIPPQCSIVLPRRYPDDNDGIMCKIMSWKSYKLQCLSSKHIKITTIYYSFVHTLGRADENSV